MKRVECKGLGSEIRTAWLILEKVSREQISVINLNHYMNVREIGFYNEADTLESSSILIYSHS